MRFYLTFSICFVLSALLAFQARAQQPIQFMEQADWDLVSAEARRANKLIFIDAHTTWCVPCKKMDQEIFPDTLVANYFNKHFVNLRIQFDSTANDNRLTVAQRPLARMLQTKYEVSSYPTFLFVDADGKLVRRITGASPTPASFMQKVTPVFETGSPYRIMQKRYDSGARDSAMLSALVKMAKQTGETANYQKYGRTWQRLKTNLFDEEGISLITEFTESMNDRGYQMLRNHPNKIDSVIGADSRIDLLRDIYYRELVVPALRTNSAATQYGPMTVYTGPVRATVDWPALEKKLQAADPALAAELMSKAKFEHLLITERWKAYLALIERMGRKKEADQPFLQSKLYEVLLYCEDPKLLTEAANIAKGTFLTNAEGHLTRAQLLEKAGNLAAAAKATDVALKTYPEDENLKAFADKLRLKR
ncbi:thioredoxin family protein [Pedobacter yulinensis]|nr:thioredoxin fold domain-containing protein [Pedobacter yulinensis]